jgi:threonine dehydrogenase-like Zn-dependent dehydrogenase
MAYRQAVFQHPRSIELQSVDPRPLGPRDVRISVTACGVCGSDVGSYLHGHYVEQGQVMGHELAGRVIQAGTDADIEVGRLVAVRPLRTCGTCWYCRSGANHLCGRSAVHSLAYGLPGGFAEQITMPDAVIGRDLVPVPDHVSPEDLLWAEPLAVALRAVGRSGAGPGSRALVVGAGSVGLCVLSVLRVAGVRSCVVEPRESRRRVALELGADEAVAPDADLPPSEVAFETSGVPAGLRVAATAVTRGPVVLLGLGDEPLAPDVAAGDLRGAFAYLDQDFAHAVNLISNGDVRLSGAISHRFPLSETGSAIAASAMDPTAVKVVVVPELDQVHRPAGAMGSAA